MDELADSLDLCIFRFIAVVAVSECVCVCPESQEWQIMPLLQKLTVCESHVQIKWAQVLLIPRMIYSLYFLLLCTSVGTCYGNLFIDCWIYIYIYILVLRHFQEELLI